MRDQIASLLIGTLADQVLDDLDHGTPTPRGQQAAERLERLLQLAVAYRSGELSEAPRDPDVSASAAHSYLTTAGFRLGRLPDGAESLDEYRTLLAAARAGQLDQAGRDVLEPFLQMLGVSSAQAARERVPAFFPGEADRRRRHWNDR